jgi:hypothetical protein
VHPHYFAWYAWNVLGLEPDDIADHLGHWDGGNWRANCPATSTRLAPVRGCAGAFMSAPAAPSPASRVAEGNNR